MRIKEIPYGIGVTINVGNYESIRPDGGAVVELDGDDDIQDAILLARKIGLRSFVQSVEDHMQIRRFISDHKEKFIEHVVRDMIGNK